MTTTADQPFRITVPLADGRTAELDAELIAPGIAVNQTYADPDLYHLTHIPSGMVFTTGGALEDQEKLRAAGRALAGTGINWDQPLADLGTATWAPGTTPRHILENLYQPAAETPGAVDLDHIDDFDFDQETCDEMDAEI